MHPRLVPQMADAEAVVAGLGRTEGISRIGLVLNKRGALRALATDLDEIGIVCAASNTFGINNQNMTFAQSVKEAVQILELCRQTARKAQVTIAVAFHCPFEGPVKPDRVVQIARTLASARPLEIALADTIGVATRAEVKKLVSAVSEAISPLPLRVLFHDTRGMGTANCWAAYKAGAQTFDASIAGLGGCPFAPGAAGNVASESVEYLFQQAGIPLGLDRAKLEEAAYWIRFRQKKKRRQVESSAVSYFHGVWP